MHTLHTEVRIPRPIEDVFAFFADAGNLQAITPPWLDFRILTPRPIEMRANALLDYRLKLRGVPIRWRTRIAAYEPPVRFIDEQLRGPYRVWRHEHTFEAATDGSTIMRDRVGYELPRVPGRGLVHRLFVRPDLERIFRYRERRLLELLAGPSIHGSAAPNHANTSSVGAARG